MKILIGGGSGFIGRHLNDFLLKRGHTVQLISRTPGLNRVTWSELEEKRCLPECDALVNLSGENILQMSRFWNEKYKEDLYDSRINKNRLLVQLIEEAERKPKVWVTANAVGYYPTQGDAEYDEHFTLESHLAKNYIQQLCEDWERSAATLAVRHVSVRIGVVLGNEGGIIQRTYWPFYFGVGGCIGSGKQFMNWVHVKDIANIFAHAIENESVKGVLNGVAPGECTNYDFTKAYGKILGRPTILPIPEFLMNAMVGNERADMMLHGCKVVPKRTIESGYKFQFSTVKDALEDLLK